MNVRPDASLKIFNICYRIDVIPSNKNARTCFQVQFNLIVSLRAVDGYKASPNLGVWEGRGLTGA